MKSLIVSFLSLFTITSFAAEVQDISAAQLLEQRNQDWLIIDVRSASEYQQGHVPGAINIAHSQLADNIAQVLSHKDKPVVVYCKSGYRASKAANVLLSHQFSQVKHLDGDMQGWQTNGHPVEK